MKISTKTPITFVDNYSCSTIINLRVNFTNLSYVSTTMRKNSKVPEQQLDGWEGKYLEYQYSVASAAVPSQALLSFFQLKAPSCLHHC